MEQRFSARRDVLYNAIFIFTIGISVGALILILLNATPLLIKLVLATVILVIILFLWMVMTRIYYLISDDVITAKIGPFSTRIPIRNIKKIAIIHSVVSSFATSYLRLRIHHGIGFTDISPDQQNAFIEAVLLRNPDIIVTGRTSAQANSPDKAAF